MQYILVPQCPYTLFERVEPIRPGLLMRAGFGYVSAKTVGATIDRLAKKKKWQGAAEIARRLEERDPIGVSASNVVQALRDLHHGQMCHQVLLHKLATVFGVDPYVLWTRKRPRPSEAMQIFDICVQAPTRYAVVRVVASDQVTADRLARAWALGDSGGLCPSPLGLDDLQTRIVRRGPPLALGQVTRNSEGHGVFVS